ncbi:hypothetical protein MPS_2847 [Mycobacterium pseudoshottsii JCM 15466]|nr:hypothetical protein MMSP_1933 [Mycobacterium sp. 012931]MBC9862377.1 hypothetical protein [Mycobacterium pseudoshottsii]GAQ35795.1 hypothetical protein MPS_2847 [Mycobacterium pseudoshottsii JCM 15466]
MVNSLGDGRSCGATGAFRSGRVDLTPSAQETTPIDNTETWISLSVAIEVGEHGQGMG